MKPCSKCLELKPLTDFGLERRVADGHLAKCKVCAKTASAEYRRNNPDNHRKYYEQVLKPKLPEKRAAYAADSRIREAVSARKKAWYKQNQKKAVAYTTAWVAENADKRREYMKVYRSRPEYRDYDNAASRKYRANPANKQALSHRQMQYTYRKLGAAGVSTKTQLKARWDYYGGKCWLCGIDATEMDHVKPLTKGGSNWPGNLRPICRSCNARKSNTWPFSKVTKACKLEGVTALLPAF